MDPPKEGGVSWHGAYEQPTFISLEAGRPRSRLWQVRIWWGLLLKGGVSSLCPHVDEGLGDLWSLPIRALVHCGGCTL